MTEARETQRPGLSRADAILIACLIFIGISILDGAFKQSLYDYSPSLFWAFDVAKFVVIPVVALTWLARRYAITPSAYGLRKPGSDGGWLQLLGVTLLLAFVSNLAYRYVLVNAWNLIQSAPAVFTYKGVVPDGWLHLPVALYFGVTAGIVEEIFCRGLPFFYLMERFPERIPVAGYVIVSGLLFGATHWENGAHEVVATSIFGFIFGAVYLNLRDLRPLILAHALIDIWNFS